MAQNSRTLAEQKKAERLAYKARVRAEQEAKQNERRAKRSNRKKDRELQKERERLQDSVLSKFVPMGNVIVKSEYIRTGGNYQTVVTMIFDQAGVADLPPVWGASHVIPSVSDPEVSVKLIPHFQTRSAEWVAQRSDVGYKMQEEVTNDAVENKDGLNAHKANTRSKALEEMVEELAHQASYLDASYKYLIIAPTKAQLDRAIIDLNEHFSSLLGSSKVVRYLGQQKEDYQNLLAPAIDQIGVRNGFTSIQAGGTYPFLGRPMQDEHGFYIGNSLDIDRGHVLWDASKLGHLNIVIASGKATYMGGAPETTESANYSATMAWTKFIATMNLIADSKRRVFDIVLTPSVANGGTYDDVMRQFDLSYVSNYFDMLEGGLNLLQTFGERKDQFNLYSALLDKIEQIFLVCNPNLDDFARAEIKNVLQDFFVSNNVWQNDAERFESKLKLVGLLDFSAYPTINRLASYLHALMDQAYKGSHERGANQRMGQIYQQLLNSILVLAKTHQKIFNVKTTITPDVLFSSQKRYNVFDLGGLDDNDKVRQLVQFINVFGFIAPQLRSGDVVQICGAENLSQGVLKYLIGFLNNWKTRDIRLVLAYGDSKKAVESGIMSHYTDGLLLLGAMSSGDLNKISGTLSQPFPSVVFDNLISRSGEEAQNKMIDCTYYLMNKEGRALFQWDKVLR